MSAAWLAEFDGMVARPECYETQGPPRSWPSVQVELALEQFELGREVLILITSFLRCVWSKALWVVPIFCSSQNKSGRMGV